MTHRSGNNARNLALICNKKRSVSGFWISLLLFQKSLVKLVSFKRFVYKMGCCGIKCDRFDLQFLTCLGYFLKFSKLFSKNLVRVPWLLFRKLEEIAIFWNRFRVQLVDFYSCCFWRVLASFDRMDFCHRNVWHHFLFVPYFGNVWEVARFSQILEFLHDCQHSFGCWIVFLLSIFVST